MKRAILSIFAITTIIFQTEATEGLVAHWSFDNDTKREVKDLVGTSHGAATKVEYRDGAIGKAALFNGVSSKIIVKDSKGNPPKAVTDLAIGTISFWVKFENRGGQVLPIVFLGKEDTSMPSRSMIFEIGHDRGNIENRRLYFTTIKAHQDNFCVDSGLNLEPGVWYHYAAVVSNEGSTLYINGVEITTRRYNLGSKKESVCFFNDVTNKELFSIGYGRYSQEEPFFSFNGLIDDVRLYDRPLSGTEVVELFKMAGMEMGDPRLGYIDAESMVGQEPTEGGRGGRGGKGGGRGGNGGGGYNRGGGGGQSYNRGNSSYNTNQGGYGGGQSGRNR